MDPDDDQVLWAGLLDQLTMYLGRFCRLVRFGPGVWVGSCSLVVRWFLVAVGIVSNWWLMVNSHVLSWK